MLDTIVAEDALDIRESNVKRFNDNIPSLRDRFVSEQSNLIPQQSSASANNFDTMK